ncbi:MAG: dUTP diphosphatase [Clostridium sp.]|uniref:dUTP diphosphatase n=1 Tax=Clostridium sp. TaxID=1506 RepID=UPI003EE67438
MILPVVLLHADARVPVYATAGAACFDFFAVEDVFIPSKESVVIRSGIAMTVPVGKCLDIFSRSGHGFKYDVRLSNCTGIIDSDYTGEIMFKLRCDSYGGLQIRRGDRIAQGRIVDVPRYEFEVVTTLAETERGNGGFGSTGA